MGFVLDQIVKKSEKSKIADWVQIAAQSRPTASLATDWLFNRVFGVKMFSFRSIIGSAIVSMISFFFIFLIAYVTSDSETRGHMWPFGEKFSMIGVLILVIFITTVIVADIVSFAQTRFFNRVIVSASHPAVSVVLIVGDFFSTISIFAGFFAFSRMIAYVVALYSGVVHAEPEQRRLYPQLLTEVLSKDVVGNGVILTKDDAAVNLLYRIMYMGSQPSGEYLKLIASDWKADRFGGYKNAKSYDFIEVSAKLECVKAENEFGPLSMVGFDAFTNSEMLALRASIDSKDATFKKINAASVDIKFKNRFEYIKEKSPNECTRLIIIESGVNWRKMIGALNVFDLYLASLEKTLTEVFYSIPSKMSAYVTINPFSSEIKNFIGLAWGEPRH
jgi:hypothetical protein